MISGMRLALRIARRDARRTKGRSALVIVLLALPVIAIAFGATLFDSMQLTTEERVERDMGASDAIVDWQYDSPVRQEPDNQWLTGDPCSINSACVDVVEHTPGTDPAGELLAHLPAGSRVTPYGSGTAKTVVPNGVDDISTIALDLTDPMTEGLYTLLDGKMPGGNGEVVLSSAGAELTGLDAGDTLTLKEPDRTFKVTGIVEEPNDLKTPFAVGTMADFPAEAQQWYVDAPGPVTWEQIQQLNTKGIVVYSKAVSLNPPSDVPPLYEDVSGPASEEISLIGLVVAMVILELVLLAGPAFAIGTKRRSREFALLAANGATAGQVRRTVLSGGLVLGAFGAMAGIVVGAGLAAAGMPIIEQLMGMRSGALRFFPAFTGPLALLAVVTGLLAALVPAFTVAKQNVVEALTGRRGAVRSKKRWLFIGIALVALGVAAGFAGALMSMTEALVMAAVLGQLGLVLCTPSIVGAISKLGRFLPLSPRIALRDAGRNRAATAPAISAVMAVVTGAIAISAFVVADQERWNAAGAPNVPEGTVTMSVNQWPGWDQKTGEELPLSPDAAQKLADAKRNTEAMLRQYMPVTGIHGVDYAECPKSASEGKGDTWCTLEVAQPEGKTCPFTGDVYNLTEEQQAEAAANKYCKESNYGYGGTGLDRGVIVDDGTTLGLAGTADDDEIAAATEVLKAGGIVVHDADLVSAQGTATISMLNTTWSQTTNEETDEVLASVTVPAYALTTGSLDRSQFYVAPSVAQQLGAQVIEDKVYLGTTSRMPTDAEEQALNGAIDAAGYRPSYNGSPTTDYIEAYAMVARTQTDFDESTYATWILAGIAGLIALGATAVATGLAAAEGRKDLSTLAAVGASPGLRRILALSQSGTISLLGAVLGVFAGLGASAAAIGAINMQLGKVYPREALFPMSMPWLILGVALVAIPVIAMLGAGLLTRSRLPVERRIA